MATLRQTAISENDYRNASQIMASPDQKVCAVCNNSDWSALSSIGTQSMTTAGKTVDSKLGKGICNHCGAVQKVFVPRLADTDFYERQYTYYDRPGSHIIDQVRYKALADWVAVAISPRKPKKIFDVGCGHGGTLHYLRELFPEAVLGGLEPSASAVKNAYTDKLEVIEGRLDEVKVSGTFDLVFSNNVLQHVTDPMAFLLAQKALLAPGGDLVLTCPDGTLPNIELLMADQNFSLRPLHLAALAAKAKLKVVRTLPCPGGALRNEQLVLLRHEEQAIPAPTFPSLSEIQAEYQEIQSYLANWATLDDFLSRATSGAKRIFNFGGGLWSYVLAGYCPQYWAQVRCCLVDKFAGRCIDKEVIPYDNMDITADDVLVLGTNPYVQQKLVMRFKEAGLRAVSFDHLVHH